MGAPIQTIPQGLLGLLQLKQTGANPTDLLNTVQPTIDLSQTYFQRQLVNLGAPGGNTRTQPTATSGQFTFVPSIVVPQNQAWWIDSYFLFANLLAAETIRMAPGFISTAIGPSFQLGVDVNDIITARARMVSCFARQFWVGPGTVFTVIVFDDLTAANITIQADILGVAVPI